MKKPDYAAAKAQVSMRDLLKHYLDDEEMVAFKEKGEKRRCAVWSKPFPVLTADSNRCLSYNLHAALSEP